MTWTSLVATLDIPLSGFPLQTEQFPYFKVKFHNGKYHKGQETWLLSLFCVWDLDQRGHLSMPRVHRLLVISVKGFVFEAVVNGCFGESCKVGHCVFCLERRPPLPRTAGAQLGPHRQRWNLTPWSFCRTINQYSFQLWLLMFSSPGMCVRSLGQM